MKWSEDVWGEIAPQFSEILSLPFITELTAGTLPEEKFLFYLRQDSVYLSSYVQVLAHIASRLSDGDMRSELLGFATDGISVERAIHQSFLAGDVSGPMAPTPTCLLYTSYLKSQVYSPVEVEMAAVLPCFRVYQRVGEIILSKANLESNPYSRWIETYADKQFAESTAHATEICDRLAAGTTPETRRLMSDAFVNGTRMEYLFWDSAYKLETWRI